MSLVDRLTGRKTGWRLEGDTGGYRDGRTFTPTAEGEIVDEAIRLEPSTPDPLLEEWIARCAQRAAASERARGERLAAVFEKLTVALSPS